MIIEDDSFALGMPTPMEMLEQHALLLQGENEQLQQGLSQARKNIEKLVAINQDQADEIGRLKRELNCARVEIVSLNNQIYCSGAPSTWGGTAPPVSAADASDVGLTRL